MTWVQSLKPVWSVVLHLLAAQNFLLCTACPPNCHCWVNYTLACFDSQISDLWNSRIVAPAMSQWSLKLTPNVCRLFCIWTPQWATVQWSSPPWHASRCANAWKNLRHVMNFEPARFAAHYNHDFSNVLSDCPNITKCSKVLLHLQALQRCQTGHLAKTWWVSCSALIVPGCRRKCRSLAKRMHGLNVPLLRCWTIRHED